MSRVGGQGQVCIEIMESCKIVNGFKNCRCLIFVNFFQSFSNLVIQGSDKMSTVQFTNYVDKILALFDHLPTSLR